MSKIVEIRSAVENGKSKLVGGLARQALDEGDPAKDILQAMVEAMSTVGDKFSAGEIFVPEMLVAARAMQNGLNVLKPELGSEGGTSLGKCIIGTVEGDLHDIGKNLVSIMLESAGFEMIDLGVDVSKEKFIDAIKANPDCRIVACSGLLTTTMTAMKDTVAAIKGANLGVKIMVGGAPVTQEFADSIGADGYSKDAGGAAAKAKALLRAA